MDNQEKREKLNKLLINVFDASCEDELCLYVFVELTDEVKGILNEIGYNDEFIDLHKDFNSRAKENYVFDLYHVAWNFANWFTGDLFIDKGSQS